MPNDTLDRHWGSEKCPVNLEPTLQKRYECVPTDKPGCSGDKDALQLTKSGYA